MGIAAIEASPTYAKCASHRDTPTRIHELILMLIQFGEYGMGEQAGVSVTLLRKYGTRSCPLNCKRMWPSM